MVHLNRSQLHHRSDSLGNHVELLSASWRNQRQVLFAPLVVKAQHQWLSALSCRWSSRTCDIPTEFCLPCSSGEAPQPGAPPRLSCPS